MSKNGLGVGFWFLGRLRARMHWELDFAVGWSRVVSARVGIGSFLGRTLDFLAHPRSDVFLDSYFVVRDF